jgi:hypothetical protein
MRTDPSDTQVLFVVAPMDAVDFERAGTVYAIDPEDSSRPAMAAIGPAWQITITAAILACIVTLAALIGIAFQVHPASSGTGSIVPAVPVVRVSQSVGEVEDSHGGTGRSAWPVEHTSGEWTRENLRESPQWAINEIGYCRNDRAGSAAERRCDAMAPYLPAWHMTVWEYAEFTNCLGEGYASQSILRACRAWTWADLHSARRITETTWNNGTYSVPGVGTYGGWQ